MNYMSALICLPVLQRPWKSFPYRWRSRCWEWPCGVCGQHTSFLSPLNSRPASLFHDLCTSPHHRLHCLQAAPLLTLRQGNPSSPPPASESRTPPRPVDPAAPPRILAPSSPLGSLVPPAPPWSVVDHLLPRDSAPLDTPLPSISVRLLLPSGSTLVLCRSGSTAAFWIPASASVAVAICSALALQIPPSPWLIGSPSPPRAPPPPALPPSVSPLESSALPPPWLLPPSAPPWVAFMAAAWVPPGSRDNT